MHSQDPTDDGRKPEQRRRRARRWWGILLILAAGLLLFVVYRVVLAGQPRAFWVFLKGLALGIPLAVAVLLVLGFLLALIARVEGKRRAGMRPRWGAKLWGLRWLERDAASMPWADTVSQRYAIGTGDSGCEAQGREGSAGLAVASTKHPAPFSRRERVVEDGVQFVDYEFEPASVFPNGLLPYDEILELWDSWIPPVLRTRDDELLFISVHSKDDVAAALRARNIPVVDRFDVWERLLEPFLDTQHSEDHIEKTLRELEAHGVSRAECARIRHVLGEPLCTYNYTCCVWDWCHLDLSDLFSSFRVSPNPAHKLDVEEFRRLYRWSMDVAICAATCVPGTDVSASAPQASSAGDPHEDILTCPFPVRPERPPSDLSERAEPQD